MRKLLVGVMTAFLALGGLFVLTAPSASAAPRTVLGQKNLFGKYGSGWGTARPKMISNGGDPSGNVTNIHWSKWGSKTAFGRGQGVAFKPGGGYYRKPVKVQLKASKIGRCTKNGPRAYKHLTARWQKKPGGSWTKWSGWLNLRDGAWNGRISK